MGVVLGLEPRDNYVLVLEAPRRRLHHILMDMESHGGKKTPEDTDMVVALNILECSDPDNCQSRLHHYDDRHRYLEWLEEIADDDD